jgi:hypothetical protein
MRIDRHQSAIIFSHREPREEPHRPEALASLAGEKIAGFTGIHASFPIFIRHAGIRSRRCVRRRSVIDCLRAIMREGDLKDDPVGAPPEAARAAHP